MNNPRRKAFRPALLTLITCVLVALAASKTVICQQTPANPHPPPPAPAPSQQQEARPLVFTVTVTNKKGGYVTGLDKSHFAILDNKRSEEVTYFKGPDEPVSIGILLDASGSMDEASRTDMIKALYREALSRFIQQSNKSNEYFIIGFNNRPQLLLDWTRDADAVTGALVKLGPMKLRGNTALYDACYMAVEKLSHSTHPKRAIILVSDGQDNQSHYTFSELRQSLKESDVVLYVVVITSRDDGNSAIGMQGMGILDEFTRIAGGLAFFPEKPSHLRNVFDLIAAELRHQYSIGFNPANHPGDREWHRVKIKLAIQADAPPDLQHLLLRSREGYFPKAHLR